MHIYFCLTFRYLIVMKRLYALLFILYLPFFMRASDSITVYIFMLEDCPITQSYTLKLNELYHQFGDQFSFVGVFPNHSSKQEKIDLFLQEYKISFPSFTDYSRTLVDQLGATITPEVVVYNSNTKTILYRGRIDNEFADLGKRRRVVTTDELKEVLNSLSLGMEKIFPYTKAVGCFINQNDPIKK